MVSIIGYVCLGLGVLVAAIWIVAWFRGKSSLAIPASAGVVSTISDYADEALGSAAAFTLATLAKKRGNAALATAASQAWTLVMAFDDQAATPSTAPAAAAIVAAPTLEQLAAEVAALRAAPIAFVKATGAAL